MIGNALLLALTLFVAFCFLLMDRLKFLVPYRQAIFHNYGWAVALYGVLLLLTTIPSDLVWVQSRLLAILLQHQSGITISRVFHRSERRPNKTPVSIYARPITDFRQVVVGKPQPR